MRLFNAFQITGIFAGFPFFISWLDQQTFRLAGVGVWTAIAIYIIAFGFNIYAWYEALESNK